MRTSQILTAPLISLFHTSIWVTMARSKTPASRPKYMKRHTDILAPSVRKSWVNGTAKYDLIRPEVGSVWIIDSDDEIQKKPAPRPMTPQIKREHTYSPSRAMERGQSQERHPRIKREQTVNTPRGSCRHGMPSSLARSGQKPASSSGESDSDDDSASSPSGSESDAYRPSKSLSRISSLSPRTLRQTPVIKTGPTPAPQESTVTGEETHKKCTPMDFYINVPMRPAQYQARNGESSRPQTSLQGAASPQVSEQNPSDW